MPRSTADGLSAADSITSATLVRANSCSPSYEAGDRAQALAHPPPSSAGSASLGLRLGSAGPAPDLQQLTLPDSSEQLRIDSPIGSSPPQALSPGRLVLAGASGPDPARAKQPHSSVHAVGGSGAAAFGATAAGVSSTGAGAARARRHKAQSCNGAPVGGGAAFGQGSGFMPLAVLSALQTLKRHGTNIGSDPNDRPNLLWAASGEPPPPRGSAGSSGSGPSLVSAGSGSPSATDIRVHLSQAPKRSILKGSGGAAAQPPRSRLSLGTTLQQHSSSTTTTPRPRSGSGQEEPASPPLTLQPQPSAGSPACSPDRPASPGQHEPQAQAALLADADVPSNEAQQQQQPAPRASLLGATRSAGSAVRISFVGIAPLAPGPEPGPSQEPTCCAHASGGSISSSSGGAAAPAPHREHLQHAQQPCGTSAGVQHKAGWPEGPPLPRPAPEQPQPQRRASKLRRSSSWGASSVASQDSFCELQLKQLLGPAAAVTAGRGGAAAAPAASALSMSMSAGANGAGPASSPHVLAPKPAASTRSGAPAGADADANSSGVGSVEDRAGSMTRRSGGPAASAAASGADLGAGRAAAAAGGSPGRHEPLHQGPAPARGDDAQHTAPPIMQRQGSGSRQPKETGGSLSELMMRKLFGFSRSSSPATTPPHSSNQDGWASAAPSPCLAHAAAAAIASEGRAASAQQAGMATLPRAAPSVQAAGAAPAEPLLAWAQWPSPDGRDEAAMAAGSPPAAPAAAAAGFPPADSACSASSSVAAWRHNARWSGPGSGVLIQQQQQQARGMAGPPAAAAAGAPKAAAAIAAARGASCTPLGAGGDAPHGRASAPGFYSLPAGHGPPGLALQPAHAEQPGWAMGHGAMGQERTSHHAADAVMPVQSRDGIGPVSVHSSMDLNQHCDDPSGSAALAGGSAANNPPRAGDSTAPRGPGTIAPGTPIALSGFVVHVGMAHHQQQPHHSRASEIPGPRHKQERQRQRDPAQQHAFPQGEWPAAGSSSPPAGFMEAVRGTEQPLPAAAAGGRRAARGAAAAADASLAACPAQQQSQAAQDVVAAPSLPSARGRVGSMCLPQMGDPAAMAVLSAAAAALGPSQTAMSTLSPPIDCRAAEGGSAGAGAGAGGGHGGAGARGAGGDAAADASQAQAGNGAAQRTRPRRRGPGGGAGSASSAGSGASGLLPGAIPVMAGAGGRSASSSTGSAAVALGHGPK